MHTHAKPFVICGAIPHRCGWEFRFAPLRYMEFNVTHPSKGLLIGPGPFILDRRDGGVEQRGSGDVGKTMPDWRHRYDAETGEAPERPLGRGRGCGC